MSIISKQTIGTQAINLFGSFDKGDMKLLKAISSKGSIKDGYSTFRRWTKVNVVKVIQIGWLYRIPNADSKKWNYKNILRIT